MSHITHGMEHRLVTYVCDIRSHFDPNSKPCRGNLLNHMGGFFANVITDNGRRISYKAPFCCYALKEYENAADKVGQASTCCPPWNCANRYLLPQLELTNKA